MTGNSIHSIAITFSPEAQPGTQAADGLKEELKPTISAHRLGRTHEIHPSLHYRGESYNSI